MPAGNRRHVVFQGQLRRWKGESPADIPPEWESLDLDGITEAMNAVDAERTDWIEQLTEDDLDRKIEYRNTRGDVTP